MTKNENEERDERVWVAGVGWVPLEALEAGLVVAGVDLMGLLDAEVVDLTGDDEANLVIDTREIIEVAPATRRTSGDRAHHLARGAEMTDSNHSYIGTKPGDRGYIGECECGWKSAEKPTKRSAQGSVAAHIGAQPPTWNVRP